MRGQPATCSGAEKQMDTRWLQSTPVHRAHATDTSTTCNSCTNATPQPPTEHHSTHSDLPGMKQSSPRSSPKRRTRTEDETEPSRRGRRVALSETLTLPNIRRYFDQPLKNAAEQLGVSINCLKRACRRLGISRWPYKELRGVRSALAGVPNLIQSASAEQRAQLEGIIASLKAEEQELLTIGSKNKNMLEDTWDSDNSSGEAKHDAASSMSSKRARRSPPEDEDEQRQQGGTPTAEMDLPDGDAEHSPESSIVSSASPHVRAAPNKRAHLPALAPPDGLRFERAGPPLPAAWQNVLNHAPAGFGGLLAAPAPPPTPAAAAAPLPFTQLAHLAAHHNPAAAENFAAAAAASPLHVDLLRRMDSLEHTVAQLVSRQTQLESYVMASFRAF